MPFLTVVVSREPIAVTENTLFIVLPNVIFSPKPDPFEVWETLKECSNTYIKFESTSA